jgi:hypothetical protein
VVGAGVLCEAHVLPRLREPLDVEATGGHRRVVVVAAVKEADGSVRDILVLEIPRRAGRIERDEERERRVGRSVHALEPLQGRVERSLPAAREAHEGDPVGRDPRVLRHQGQRAVRIHDHREPPELRLVVAGVLDPAGREAVEGERRDAERVQLVGPVVDEPDDAARAVHQDDERQPSRPGRKAELTGDDDRLPFLLAEKELLVRQRGGLEGVVLDPRDLRARGARREQPHCDRHVAQRPQRDPGAHCDLRSGGGECPPAFPGGRRLARAASYGLARSVHWSGPVRPQLVGIDEEVSAWMLDEDAVIAASMRSKNEPPRRAKAALR